MKKNLVILMTLLAMLAFASTSFAAAISIVEGTGSTIGDALFVPSTGVTVGLNATTTEYSANSKHESGNRCYATLSSGSEIEVTPDITTCPVGQIIVAPTATDAIALTSS